jgi:hypothetical protein
MLMIFTCVVGLLLGLQAAALPGPLQHRVDYIDATLSRSCSIASFSNVTDFILRDYEIETVVDTDNITQTLATFTVENPGSGDTYRLYRIPISTGGGVWSVCRAGETPLPSLLQRCQYLLERRSGGRVGFRFQWYCDDKDPSQPYATIPSLTSSGEQRELTCPADI